MESLSPSLSRSLSLHRYKWVSLSLFLSPLVLISQSLSLSFQFRCSSWYLSLSLSLSHTVYAHCVCVSVCVSLSLQVPLTLYLPILWSSNWKANSSTDKMDLDKYDEFFSLSLSKNKNIEPWRHIHRNSSKRLRWFLYEGQNIVISNHWLGRLGYLAQDHFVSNNLLK